MTKVKYIFTTLVVLVMLSGCFEGPTGPQGEQGQQGEQGPQGEQGIGGSEVSVITGTIYNVNYTEGNPTFVSINLPSATYEHVVLSFGIENLNQIYNNYDWQSTIYSAGSDDYSVNGVAGYYLICYDPLKSLATKKYQIKYIK